MGNERQGVQAGSDRRQNRRSLDGGRPHLRPITQGPVPPLPLGAVEGEVRVLHQVGDGAVIVRKDGDSDACAGAEALALKQERLAQSGQQGLREGHPGAIAAAGFKRDRKLVTAEPGQDAVRSQAAQARRHFAKQGVASIMPHHVVDVLEVVEVDEQQREPCFRGLGAGDLVREEPEEMGAVGETRQRIVVRGRPQPLLRLLTVRYLEGDAHDALGKAVRHDGGPRLEPAMLVAAKAVFDAGGNTGMERPQCFDHPLAVIGMDMIRPFFDAAGGGAMQLGGVARLLDRAG